MNRWKPSDDVVLWLRQTYVYEPLTGHIRKGEKTVGGINTSSGGYIQIQLTNTRLQVRRNVQAHCLAWFLYYGVWPIADIDHHDLNKINNKLDNLRLASESQNCANRIKQSLMLGKKCLSSFKGVTKHKCSQKWVAAIGHNNRLLYIGSFHDEVEAAKAYDLEAVRLFGEYARTNFGSVSTTTVTK